MVPDAVCELLEMEAADGNKVCFVAFFRFVFTSRILEIFPVFHQNSNRRIVTTDAIAV